MPPTLLHLDFRGYTTPLAPGVLLVRANTTGAVLGSEREAFLEGRLSFVGDTAFDLVGTVAFGDSTALRFRNLGLGVIGEADEPGLRAGAAVCEIDSGSGAFEHGTGRITSNFVLSDGGEITDHQVVLLFARAAVAR